MAVIPPTAPAARAQQTLGGINGEVTDSSGAVVGFNLHFNMLAKAAIMGLYKRVT